MLNEKLEKLNLPPFPASREAALDMLLHEEYGYLPPKPVAMTWETLDITPRFCGGKAPLHKMKMHCTMPNGKEFSFEFQVSVPQDGKKHPAFLHINFRNTLPDIYQPSEELCDNGYGVFTLCYNDIAPDREDGFKEGLSAVLFENGERNDTDPGKIAMWAWGACRVMDYICTREDILHDKVTVVGHSRLGKTALLTGAVDERFYCAISNDSGTSGAAITRGKQGETVRDICTQFPYWFCKNYYKYQDNEDTLPFDQHWLIGLLAPRYAYVCSASNDLWADPEFEHLACKAAAPLFGENGFVTPDRAPEIGDSLHEGKIGYHLRWGEHYLSRTDWLNYLNFLEGKE